MNFRVLSLSTALCTGLLAGLASAQSISDVTSSNDSDPENPPIEASVGSEITITGTAFGTAKPKVFLTNGEGKKYVLKVTAFSDTEITAEIKKAVAGELTLNVQPKGVDEPLTADVTIRTPSIDGGELVESADSNTEFMIPGEFFGTKKGKIFIGGKKAKVVSWADDMIHVIMPKKLANGLWDILLDNKVGIDEDEEITTTNSNAKIGKTAFNVFVDGNKLKLKYGKGVVPPGFGVAAVGTSATNPSHTVVVAVPFLDGDTFPQDFVWGTDLFVVTYVKTTLNGQIPSAEVYVPDNGFVCNITANSAGQAAGNFEGTMTLQGGATQIDVEGDFVVETIEVAP